MKKQQKQKDHVKYKNKNASTNHKHKKKISGNSSSFSNPSIGSFNTLSCGKDSLLSPLGNLFLQSKSPLKCWRIK